MQTNNMTHGKPLHVLAKFALPVLLGNLCQQLYQMVDAIVVGQFVGTQGLAAVGATASLQFLFFSLLMGLASGVGVVIAQYFGANQTEKVQQSIFNGAWMVAVVAVIISAIATIFAEQCLIILNTPADILPEATIYLRTTAVGIVAIAAYNSIAEILRALGDSRTALKFLVLSSVLNIVLDLLFILVFHMGVFGAAFATILSQGIAAIGAIIYGKRRNPYLSIPKNLRKIEKPLLARCAKTGFPIAMQFSMIAISCIVLQAVVNGFGSMVVAAFTVTSRVENLISQPYMTLTTALTAFSGQNFGAGKIDRVKQGFKQGALLVTVYTLVLMPAVYFGAALIFRVFVEDMEVITFGAEMLQVICLFYPFLGMIYLCRGVLNGVGDVTFAFMSGVLEMLGRICLTAPLTQIKVIGVVGIWLAGGITWSMAGVAGMLRYRFGKWHDKELL